MWRIMDFEINIGFFEIGRENAHNCDERKEENCRASKLSLYPELRIGKSSMILTN